MWGMKMKGGWTAPANTLLLGSSGFLFAVLVLAAGAERTGRSAAFIKSPHGLAWLLMNGVQGAFWFVSIPHGVRWYRAVWTGWRHRPWSIPLGLLLGIAVQWVFNLIFAGIYHPRDLPLSGHLTRVGVLNLVGGFIAMAAVVGIWLTQGVLESGFTEEESSFERAERLMVLRRQAQGFLSVAGFIIGSATLSFGVLRNALMALEPSREDFPPILVIVWGVFYSVFLALAYAPMFFALADAEQRVVRDLVPTPSHLDRDPLPWLTKREELRKGLHQTGWPQLQSVLSVFAPLLGSVISILVSF